MKQLKTTYTLQVYSVINAKLKGWQLSGLKKIIKTGEMSLIRSPHVDKGGQEQFVRFYRKAHFSKLNEHWALCLMERFTNLFGPDRLIIYKHNVEIFESKF